MNPAAFARSPKVAAPGLSVPGTVPIDPLSPDPISLGKDSPIIPSGRKNWSKAPASRDAWIIPFPPELR